jgi:hypothetical protein
VESVGQRIRKFSPATARYAAMKPGISGPGKERIFSRVLVGGRCGKEIGAMRARIEAVEHFHWFERF